ncbi:MAG: 7-carboxy-7-deazaguanine synthase QueE [Zoogloeaceae bacterium]|jgi:7-carboxy-7-deazaguanine synthase|nr:7-carboxy-7-deazaguanine synthase QueE [Zoogloeaceae bacterium]
MATASRETLNVSEIFFSLQGEASRVGLPTVFVRLSGCPLRCVWCDTTHAFRGGTTLSISDILAKAATHPVRRACVTGGEPLAQKGCLALLARLCDQGYDVSLETSGALDIRPVDMRVSRIVDLKTPSSGEADRNYVLIADRGRALTARDEIKVVIADHADYEWAKARLAEHRLYQRCPVLFSPVMREDGHGMTPRDLAGWILADGLEARFQMQLHRLIWGNMRGK